MSKKIIINGSWPIILPDSSADEWLGNMKHHGNTWEMPRLQAIRKFVNYYQIKNFGKEPTILYIGAYKGDMAALLASWGAKLMLIESTAAFWPMIKETWELNDLPKPLAMFSGLASRESRYLEQTDFSDWPGRTAEYIEGAVGFTHLAESKDDPTFPQVSIDDFVAKAGFQPDLITIDIEGSELEAAYGGLDQIVTKKPAWLLSVHPEFMFHNHGTYERELHDLLRNNKYKGEWLDYDHEHHWLYEIAK